MRILARRELAARPMTFFFLFFLLRATAKTSDRETSDRETSEKAVLKAPIENPYRTRLSKTLIEKLGVSMLPETVHAAGTT